MCNISDEQCAHHFHKYSTALEHSPPSFKIEFEAMRAGEALHVAVFLSPTTIGEATGVFPLNWPAGSDNGGGNILRVGLASLRATVTTSCFGCTLGVENERKEPAVPFWPGPESRLLRSSSSKSFKLMLGATPAIGLTAAYASRRLF